MHQQTLPTDANEKDAGVTYIDKSCHTLTCVDKDSGGGGKGGGGGEYHPAVQYKLAKTLHTRYEYHHGSQLLFSVKSID